MNKEQFLSALRQALSDVPASEAEKSLAFYAECIADRMEDGMSEYEAVAALGDMDAILREIRGSLPLSTVVKRRLESEQRKSGVSRGVWIALVVLGSPIWLPLLLVLGAVLLTVYVCLWVVVICVFAVPLALLVTGIALLGYLLVRGVALGVGGVLMLLGGAAAVIGLGALLLVPVAALAVGVAKLTSMLWRRAKGRIGGKGGN